MTRATATKATKSTARPTRARKAAQAEAVDQVRRIAAQTVDGVSLDFKSKSEAGEVEMEKLFSIDDRDFFIPKEFGPNVALAYIDTAIDKGQEMALGAVLRKVIGEEGWKALIEFDDLTAKQFAALLTVIMRKIMGVIEATTEGN